MGKTLTINVPSHNNERLGESITVDVDGLYEQTVELYEQYLCVLVEVVNVSLGEFATLRQAMKAYDKYVDLEMCAMHGGTPTYFATVYQHPKFLLHIELGKWHESYNKLLRTLSITTINRNNAKSQTLSQTKTSFDIERSKQMTLVLETKHEALKRDLDTMPGGTNGTPSLFTAAEWGEL
jgi:hypothetical protein